VNTELNNTEPDPGVIESEAVARCLQGDRTGFDELALKYRGLVYALAYNVLEDVTVAEDVVQETFLKAYLKLDSLKEPSRFASWLRQITLRECWAWADKRRRRKKREAEYLDEQSLLDPLIPSAETDDEAPWIERILKVIKELSDDHCQILALYYVKGLTHREISNFLNVPHGTVKRRLFDARKRIQDSTREEHQRPVDSEAVQFMNTFHEALKNHGVI
jgi:RNA polymerase sigma factor (sigma-70 family)